MTIRSTAKMSKLQVVLTALLQKNNIKHKEYNNIQKVLKEKGISQRALAKRMGRYKDTVSIWCRNERQPTLKALFEMAEILGVNIVELINTEQK